MWFKNALALMETEQGVRSLPTGVHILPVEVRVEVSDPIQQCTCRASFDEALRPNRLADQLQPVAIGDERIDRPIVERTPINSGHVLGKRMLAIKLVIFKTPVIQSGEELLEKIEDLGIGGIERRRVVVPDDLSFLIA